MKISLGLGEWAGAGLDWNQGPKLEDINFSGKN